MDWLKRILGQGTETAATVDPAARVMAARERLMDFERPAVALEIADGPVPGAPVSSLGGHPSLPPKADWPMAEGRPMLHLAQIAYAEMPPLAVYPHDGLLSFFVADGDLNGCEFPSRDQAGFRTFYFDQTDDLIRRKAPDAPEYDPLSPDLRADGRRLTGQATHMAPTPGCYVMDRVLQQMRDVPDDQIDELIDEMAGLRPAVLYYGGHPDFTQSDFRKPKDQLSDVLLQMGFLPRSKTSPTEICWGDAGEATFLIKPDDLEARKFERAVYNWDCG